MIPIKESVNFRKYELVIFIDFSVLKQLYIHNETIENNMWYLYSLLMNEDFWFQGIQPCSSTFFIEVKEGGFVGDYEIFGLTETTLPPIFLPRGGM